MTELKPKEQRVLDFIREWIELNGYPPAVRDICAALNFKSTSTVHMYVHRLEEKGYLSLADGKSRAIRTERIPDPSDTNRYHVPILGQVAAGIPIMTIENFDGYLDYSTHKHYDRNSLFALKIAGTSMVEAGILDGDFVIVEHCTYAENGDIVVAMIDDSATCKRFFKENGHYRLQPENAAMEPILTDAVDILGKVVACMRYY